MSDINKKILINKKDIYLEKFIKLYKNLDFLFEGKDINEIYNIFLLLNNNNKEIGIFNNKDLFKLLNNLNNIFDEIFCFLNINEYI